MYLYLDKVNSKVRKIATCPSAVSLYITSVLTKVLGRDYVWFVFESLNHLSVEDI